MREECVLLTGSTPPSTAGPLGASYLFIFGFFSGGWSPDADYCADCSGSLVFVFHVSWSSGFTFSPRPPRFLSEPWSSPNRENGGIRVNALNFADANVF